MRTYQGRVAELQLDPAGRRSARIACPTQAIPAPGKYLLATDKDSLLGIPLFQGGPATNGFLATPPLPASWAPGTPLVLLSPQGRGFHLPAGLGRLALVAVGESTARLLPLARKALEENTAVTLYTDAHLPDLPLSVEAFPLGAAVEAPGWADFLAVEVALEVVPELRNLLGSGPDGYLPCPGQALVLAPMPCAGVGECGVCALQTRRSWKLACKDGPVFDLKELIV